jgi:hypothetical protein
MTRSSTALAAAWSGDGTVSLQQVQTVLESLQLELG